MKTVYVIGDDVTDREPEFRSKGYRVVNCDIDGMISPELLPMRIGMLIKADFIFLQKGWEDDPTYRSEYLVAMEFKKEFIYALIPEDNPVVSGNYKKEIADIATCICMEYGRMPFEDVFISSKQQPQAFIRFICYYILKVTYGFTAIHIGEALRVNRIDVYPAIRTISGYMAVDRKFAIKLNGIKNAVRLNGHTNGYVYNYKRETYDLGELSPIFSDVTPSTIIHAPHI